MVDIGSVLTGAIGTDIEFFLSFIRFKREAVRIPFPIPFSDSSIGELTWNSLKEELENKELNEEYLPPRTFIQER